MTQSTTMPPPKSYQTDADLRMALIDRIEEFCRLTGMSRSRLGLEVLNDNRAVIRFEGGRTNITLDTYQKLSRYLDERWPRETKSPALAAGNLEKENG